MDINKKYKNSKTSLFYACFSRNERLVKYLIKYWTDIDKEEIIWGWTPYFKLVPVEMNF